MQQEKDGHLRYVALVYRMRRLGSMLGGLPVASVLYQQHAAAWSWCLLVMNAVIWPHVAYLVSSQSSHPARAEQGNFLVEALMVGAWMALMRFNLLPTAMLVAMLAMNHVSAGGWRLLSRSLAVTALACPLLWWFVDARAQPVSDMLNVVACLPLLLINPVWLSKVNYTLSRRVREQNRLLDQLNRTDALTGLPNRTHWLETAEATLQQYQRHGRPAALILIDLDDFKQVNDGYGHAEGDARLCQLAEVLRATLRELDTPGRLGGDEFGVVLPDTDARHALAVAERIRHHVERAHAAHGGRPYRSTVSLGVAMIDPITSDVPTWVRRADLALYQAKSEGRNRVCEASSAV